MTDLLPALVITACPSCGLPCIATPDRLITPTPVPLGIRRPDGSTYYAGELLDQLRHGGPAGHGDHTCPPPGTQPSLFDTQEA